MTRSGRRRLYVTGAILLVVALVGGRWLAVETAERAWDRTFAGGTALIDARNLALLLQALALVVAVTWATGNLLIVYRAIGSVQMPRRLGDLEIVEAVSHKVLFGGTLLLGLILGILFSLGTGDWWRHVALASSPPHFGLTDGRLGLDAGYYVGVLPWRSALQNRALVLALGTLAIVVLLYSVIGSLRMRRGRIRASDHARAHCGVLLAVVALVISWGALLDPAEVIAGMHGPVDQAALGARMPGAMVVAAISILTAGISLLWAWRDRPNLIVAAWVALLLSAAAGYFVIPGIVRASGGPETPAFVQRRAAFERVAFGLTDVDERPIPAFPSGEAAIRSLPVWDAAHVASAVNAPVTGVTLRPGSPGEGGGGAASWLIAPTNTRAPVRIALETDTGLAVTALPIADGASAPLFGPGVDGPFVASNDTAAGARARGVPISGAWRRFAIAWTIQDWALLRAEMDDHALLWRRDVTERLEHLAPFASFRAPTPVIRSGALWWVSWGYVSQAGFPYARPLTWDDADVRYLRAGLVGAVRVATGETHVWLAPGHDSLTAAWARRFDPLIERADRLPPDLRAQLTYPGAAFDAAVTQLLRVSADSADPEAAWSSRPREPYQLVGPGGDLWTAVAFEQGTLVPRFIGLCAGAVTPRGLELHLSKPSSDDPERLPGVLVGSTTLRPGQLRIWPTANSLITVQAQIVDPMDARTAAPPRIADVYVSLDSRSGHGPTARAALRGGEVVATDTSVAARWERARRLAVRADSALSAGDLELFGKLWRALMGELAPTPRRR